MRPNKQTKINKLITTHPHGIVFLASWLKEKGYSLDLLKKYRTSHWLQSIGQGAMIRFGDNVDYYGAIHTIQNQAHLNIHIGARSALSLLGKSHYLEFSQTQTILFGNNIRLPSWFSNYNWGVDIKYYTTSILPPDVGMISFNIKEFEIKISGAIRAIMECLYLAPKYQELSECYELMEGLNNLRPSLVQELLEKCSSVKVKRLFLCLASRIGHEWFNHIDITRINLGSGKRSIVKNGIYDPKYQITIPSNW